MERIKAVGLLALGMVSGVVFMMAGGSPVSSAPDDVSTLPPIFKVGETIQDQTAKKYLIKEIHGQWIMYEGWKQEQWWRNVSAKDGSWKAVEAKK